MIPIAQAACVPPSVGSAAVLREESERLAIVARATAFLACNERVGWSPLHLLHPFVLGPSAGARSVGPQPPSASRTRIRIHGQTIPAHSAAFLYPLGRYPVDRKLPIEERAVRTFRYSFMFPEKRSPNEEDPSKI